MFFGQPDDDGLHTGPKHVVVSYIKGKSVPLEASSGPDGSRKLRFPDFMTTAQESGKVVSFTHRVCAIWAYE